MGKVTDVYGKPGADATAVNFSSFNPESVASSPATSAGGAPAPSAAMEAAASTSSSAPKPPAEEPSAVDEFLGATSDLAASASSSVSDLFDSASSSASGLVDDVVDRVEIDKVKNIAKDVMGDDGLVEDLQDIDFWKDVAKGDIGVDDILESTGISGLVNSMSGANCMETDLSDFWDNLLGNLLDRGWGLGDGNFFECLLTDLKNMGVGFVNSIGDNIETIVKDTSMEALNGVASVLEEEAKEIVPQFKEGLESFVGSGDEEEDGSFVNDVMSSFDDDWALTDNGDIDLDSLDAASDAAKAGLSTVDDEDISMGLEISGWFEEALDAGEAYLEDNVNLAI